MLTLSVLTVLALSSVDAFTTRGKMNVVSHLTMADVEPEKGSPPVVKRTLWDGTVQNDKWKDPNEIKIFEGKEVIRGVDPSGTFIV